MIISLIMLFHISISASAQNQTAGENMAGGGNQNMTAQQNRTGVQNSMVAGNQSSAGGAAAPGYVQLTSPYFFHLFTYCLIMCESSHL
jgi:hypothetical protein